jgi:cytochrome c oxidase assembly protein subunit 15
MTFLLLVAGGLVTSTDAGLSVPDWPLSYGTLFPPMVGGIRYEHTHRMIAAVVGLMIAILAGWLWRREPRRWVRGLGYGALAAVICQAILGGLTVLWLLPPSVSVAHACLGQLVFCLVVGIALVASPRWSSAQSGVSDSPLRRGCLLTTSTICFQLLLGAIVRHAGVALVPHIVGAMAVAGMTGWIAWRVIRDRFRHQPLIGATATLLACLVGQLALGVLTLLHRDHVVLVTAHVAVGALLLAASWALTLMALAAPRLVT